MTPWQHHKLNWHDCTRCPLHLHRKQVVLARGSLPCDVLLCGEAPGNSENIIGQPFVGSAGHLLDEIVSQAVIYSGKPTLRFAFTNLVACIPLDDDLDKTAEPSRESIEACDPRLEEFLRVARPRLLVAVGRLAAKYTDSSRFLNFCEIIHPAAVLRQNVAMRPMTIKRAVVTLANALELICQK